MVDEILCPSCHKLNEIHKFCIFCGHKLLDDDQIRVMKDNQQPHCLNCGRPAKSIRTICECGYEFHDILCSKCTAKNDYTNMFCTSCGEKLWTSDVYNYRYPERLFEHHLINEELPHRLYNTSLYKRAKNNIGKDPLDDIGNLARIEDFKSMYSKIDNYLCEICSRWKIVSPYYCINCLGIIKPDEYSCSKCGFKFLGDKKRVESLKTDKYYVEPIFSRPELKWASKGSEYYLGSLAPAIGESQFEYRERLKWEFAENNNLKIHIKHAIGRKKQEEERKKLGEVRIRQYEERKKQEAEYIKQFGGGYCSLNCRHCYEEFFDGGGAIAGDFDSGGYVEYYCRLGHSVAYGCFCKDYE